MASVGALARKEGIIVVASIHQPSYATLSEFSSLVILSQGVVCYRGIVTGLERFLTQMGVDCKPFVSRDFSRTGSVLT
jgi:ABC-type multidrug transport system ATPase subunit